MFIVLYSHKSYGANSFLPRDLLLANKKTTPMAYFDSNRVKSKSHNDKQNIYNILYFVVC